MSRSSSCDLLTVMLLVSLPACDVVIGLDRDLRCADTDFVNPQALRGLDPAKPKYEPAISTDELELFYREDDSLMVSRRQSTADDFSSGTPFEIGAAGFSEGNPSLSEGDSRIVFDSNRMGARGPFEATRMSTGAFGNLQQVAEFAGDYDLQYTHISTDGLTLYVVRVPADAASPPDPNRREVIIATRPTVNADFGAKRKAFDGHLTTLALSPDQLELFFNRQEDLEPGGTAMIRRLVRTSTAVDFEPSPTAEDPGETITAGRDPFVSGDSSTLVYAVGGALYTMHRTCN